MAEAIRLEVWCDVHPDRPGVTIDATLLGSTRVVDLCAECISELVEPLAAVLQRYGHAPHRVVVHKPANKGEAGHYPCTMPACGKTYRHKQTLRWHVQRWHQRTLAEMYAEHGDGGARRDGPPTAGAYECPTCGHIFTTPQGLGSHRLSHGVSREETRAALRVEQRARNR